MDGFLFTVLFYCHLLTLCFQFIVITPYTLTPSQSITDGESLISEGGTFRLGFFSPSSNSRNRYLGIWYNTISTQTVVWVANRDSPVLDTSGVFKIGSSGNLVILVNHRIIWSSAKSSLAVKTPILEFLESGNLVVRDGYRDIWQSFDYPTDTLLPGMKVGWNVKTGINRYLTSWKIFDDPSPGDFTYGIELLGHPEFFVRNGSRKYYRPGSWNGIQDTGSPEHKASLKFTFYFVHNAEETYFTYKLVHPSVWRFVLTQTSSECRIQRLAWVDKINSWVLQVSIPRDRCDDYGLCGVYSSCDMRDVEICQCLEGFKPKSPGDWNQSGWSQGCERKVPVNCSDGEGFVKHTGVKLPETTGSWVDTSMNLEECRVKCLKDCSCMAYSNSDIRDGGSGCTLWFTELIDMRHMIGAGQDIYIRMAASELVKFKKKQHSIWIVSVTLLAAVTAFGLGSWFMWKKRSQKLEGGSKKNDLDLPTHITTDDLDLPLYDFITITLATNNFSAENKLGEGGFGPVYRGMLEGEEIAVKRLSTDSVQGVDEFKNEVKLISKLQHRNLVKILGFCIQREEKILVYEYMQNRSLDSFIFDETKSRLLDWQKRFEIILGIARGILYLHHDSRLRIIHRDLKASNILLDHEMVPKISDFGMARIFKADQNEARTKRVIGTRGYMSPEYVLDGRFSEKSDVFSFGVLVLEIISGKRNRGFSHSGNDLNLLGHAWTLWKEGKSMEMADSSMRNSCITDDVSRCIHIGLLCVQKNRQERPTMWSVMLMLSSEIALQKPQPPGFFMERSTSSKEKSSDKEPQVSNDCSITLLEGR